VRGRSASCDRAEADAPEDGTTDTLGPDTRFAEGFFVAAAIGLLLWAIVIWSAWKALS
jgi:hypothetical protein